MFYFLNNEKIQWNFFLLPLWNLLFWNKGSKINSFSIFQEHISCFFYLSQLFFRFLFTRSPRKYIKIFFYFLFFHFLENQIHVNQFFISKNMENGKSEIFLIVLNIHTIYFQNQKEVEDLHTIEIYFSVLKAF